MRLACTGMLSRVEECKKRMTFLADGILLPCLQGSIRKVEVIFFKYVRLWFVLLCCQDEMVEDDRVLVQHQIVRWIRGWYLCYKQLRSWAFEGIKGLLRFLSCLWCSIARGLLP